jgi:hypothetical protein
METKTENKKEIIKCNDGVERSIEIEKDYDGYFESLSKRIFERINNKEIKGITVSAGPYRAYAFMYEKTEEQGIVNFDFYSAIRTGFGSLSSDDIDSAVKELNELKF